MILPSELHIAATVVIGGFMGVGVPEDFLDELLRQRKSDLFVDFGD
jgi:acyl CoA:acetate/3-ketoacid CoA transferase alpha subunit